VAHAWRWEEGPEEERSPGGNEGRTMASSNAQGAKEPLLWSTDQTILLHGDVDREGVLGQAKVLDEGLVCSVTSAAELLNGGAFECAEGYCVVYSASSGGYYLMYRRDSKESAAQFISHHLQKHADASCILGEESSHTAQGAAIEAPTQPEACPASPAGVMAQATPAVVVPPPPVPGVPGQGGEVGEGSLGPVPLPPGAKVTVRQVVKYRCPRCYAIVATTQEARAHCSDEETGSTRSSEGSGGGSSSGADSTPTGAVPMSAACTAATPTSVADMPTMLPAGDPVAYDDHGLPMIVRQVDSGNGKMRHVVRNENGALKIFGESTIASLADSKEDDAQRWVDDLTDREMRALVCEVGQRLLSNSRLYEHFQSKLGELADASDYMYFGLEAGASDRDLDNAYRRLAKRMHPDKNGGTEEAKRRFQQMKERYEAIKVRRNRGKDREKGGEGGGHGEGDEAERPPGHGRQEAYDEDEACAKDEEQDRTIQYDPTDRQSLHKTVWKMLDQFKTMRRGLNDLTQQLKKAGAA